MMMPLQPWEGYLCGTMAAALMMSWVLGRRKARGPNGGVLHEFSLGYDENFKVFLFLKDEMLFSLSQDDAFKLANGIKNTVSKAASAERLQS